MHLARLCAVIGALVATTWSLADSNDSLSLTDFSSPQSASNWRAINDTVMGGRSRGGPRVESSALVFAGEISLANRGGFSSTRSRGDARDLSAYEGIELLVKGDGRAYYVTMNTRETSWFMEVYYWALIQPEAGGWSVIRVPFERFVPTVHGRELRGHALDTSDVRSIGLMLYDKKAGPFRIELGEARAYRKGSPIPPAQDIVATANKAGTFGTLLAAANAAGLVEALRGRGPLTVLAPTDEAFAKLPAGTVAKLLEPGQREALAQILKLHVILGAVSLEAAVAAGQAASLEGSTLSFSRQGAVGRVGEASILAPDLQCSNGVIHVIDRVLLPAPNSAPERGTAQPSAVAPASGWESALIELAVERGVPLFNAGQHAACHAIYEIALTGLLRPSSAAITEGMRAAITEALTTARGERPAEAAWRLRRALNEVYATLGSTTSR